MNDLQENAKETVELSNDLTAITEEIKTDLSDISTRIFRIGRRLKHVKENDLAHGEFGKWLEDVGMTRDYAGRFIRIYEELGDSDYVSGRNLGIKALYEISQLPPEQRTQTHTTAKGEKKLPEDMTVKELRELKRQLKQAEQAKELAEQQAESAQERERVANERAERLEQREPEVRTEYKTEYPSDYEELRKENAELRSKYGEGVHRRKSKSREELFQEFAEDLDYIRKKYGSIVFDSEKLQEYGERNREYAVKVNSFDDFWKQYVGAVLSGTQTIIDMEAK